MIKMRSPKLAALVAVFALALPATAVAQSSVDGYNDSNRVAGLEQGSGGGGGNGSAPATASKSSTPASTQSSDSSGKLPFTGADLGVIAGAGGLLLLLGVGLRRMTHGPSHA
jgi:hypothetical protein